MISKELYKIRFLLLFEISLLVLFAVFDYIPIIVILSLIFLAIILYKTFNSPIIATHILMFSILADSFLPIKNLSTSPSLSIVEFCLITLFGLVVIKFLLNVNNNSSIPSLILVWLPFLIWGLAIGLLVGIDKLRILTYWKNYFAGFFALGLTIYAIRNKLQLKSVILAIVIWGILLSLLQIKVLFDLGGFAIGIIGLFLKKNLLTIGWGRSNYLAAFFVIIIPITIGYLLYSKSKRIKIFLMAALVLMSFSLILTLSRGGILSLLIALSILFLRVVKFRTLLPFAVVLLFITIVVMSNPLTYVLIDRISSLDATSSYFTRLNYYEDVWNTFLKHPFSGVGFGNLSYYATFVLAKDASPSAHNIILGMLGEIGLFGAILYFAILVMVFKSIYSDYHKESDESLKILKWCFISSIIGAYIHSLMEPTLEGLQFSIMFWTLVGAGTRLNLLKFSEIKSNIKDHN